MNEYLNQIEISGITYDLVASGGTGSGVTPAEVQEMINQSISGMSGDINVISGDVVSLSEDVQIISGDIIVVSGDVIALETKIGTLSGNVYTKSETSGKTELDTEFGKYYKKTETSSKTEIDDALNQKQDILIAGSGISIVNNVISASGGGITSGEVMDIVSGYTYDKDTIDDKIASGGTFDPTLYYKKSETSGKTEIQNALDLKLDASAFTESDYYKKTETSGKTELSTEFAKYYKKDETSGKTELSNEFALYYKKDETSGKTELADEFDKYYKKSETSSKTEIDDAFSAITKVIEDNEKVVARALNELNDKKVESGDVIDIVSGYTYSKAVIDEKVASGGTFDLPIYSGSGRYAIVINNSGNTASGMYSVAEGNETTASGAYSHAEGWNTQASGQGSHAEGNNTQATYFYAHAEGNNTKASGMYGHAEGWATQANTEASHAEGYQTRTSNLAEHASGKKNLSISATTDFGDSGNTLFSVGNGDFHQHNALDIRQNGDIYIANTNASGKYDEKPMIKLQDALSQGGGITSGEVQTMIDQSISGKANSSDVYTKNETYTKTEVDNKFWCGTESEWSQISGSTQSGTLYLIY